MHDRLDHPRMSDDAALAAALRALPSEAPVTDAWPRLLARARRRRAVRRVLWTGLPAALAACAALFFAWPHLHLQQSMPPPVRLAQSAAPAPATTAAISPQPDRDIAALQASSMQWQSWVQELGREGAPLDGRALADAVALQDRIGLLDVQLSAARNPATVADLWQQRIALLQQLGLLHLQPYLVAAQPRPAQAIPM